MTRFLPLFLLSLLASCGSAPSDRYNIKGTSTLPDGKLYLLAMGDSAVKRIDSCDVVHGAFTLSGHLDTTTIVQLFMEQLFAIPVVLEPGTVTVTIDRTAKRASGTPLNDCLYGYIDRHTQLYNRSRELEQRATKMILEGYDEQEIARQVQTERAVLPRQKDSLETNFIISNANNVLGAYAFQMLAEEVVQSVGYPVMTPQMEEIMLKVPASFKNDAYVSYYCRVANDIVARIKDEQNLKSTPVEQ